MGLEQQFLIFLITENPATDHAVDLLKSIVVISNPSCETVLALATLGTANRRAVVLRRIR